MKSKGVVILLALAMVLGLASAAMAGNFTWSVSGSNEVTQGQSINWTISVTAAGGLQHDKPNPTFTVNSVYHIGDGSDTPINITGFTRTPKNPNNDDLSGTVTGTITLEAGSSLAPGDYQISISPTVSNGMDPLLPQSFPIKVLAAESKPIVTIISPADQSKFLYGTEIPIDVTAKDATNNPVNSVQASLDGGEAFNLEMNLSDNLDWTGSLNGLAAGSHTLEVTATNGAGTTTATSTFKVYYDFGGWLPPLAVSNKQMKAGSTLPVKFRIVGAMGPIEIAKPEVWMNGNLMGTAQLLYDENAIPYYQLNVKLPATTECKIEVKEPYMDCQAKSFPIKP